MATKERMLQDFPGINNVRSVLPHPGKLFLAYFALNNRAEIGLAAHWKNGLSFDLIARLGGLILVKEANINIRRLPIDRDCIPDFEVRPDHVGKGTDFILEKEARYFKERYLEQLRKIVFSLELGPPDKDILSHSDQYPLFFWDLAEGPGFQSYQPRRKMEIYLVCQDKEGFPCNISNRMLYWDQLIDKKKNFLEYFKNILKWHRNWAHIKLLVKHGAKIDFDANWEACRQDILKHSSLN